MLNNIPKVILVINKIIFEATVYVWNQFPCFMGLPVMIYMLSIRIMSHSV